MIFVAYCCGEVLAAVFAEGQGTTDFQAALSDKTRMPDFDHTHTHTHTHTHKNQLSSMIDVLSAGFTRAKVAPKIQMHPNFCLYFLVSRSH